MIAFKTPIGLQYQSMSVINETLYGEKSINLKLGTITWNVGL